MLKQQIQAGLKIKFKFCCTITVTSKQVHNAFLTLVIPSSSFPNAEHPTSRLHLYITERQQHKIIT